MKPQKTGSFTPVLASSKKGRIRRKKKNGRSSGKTDSVIYWCGRCNLPLIGNKCHLCGGTAHPVRLGQPGDVRFCSPFERDVLRDLLKEDYGIDPFGNRIVLLNKVPGDDRNDEVIIDGHRVGFFYYSIPDRAYAFDPTPEGASLLSGFTDKRTVRLHPTKKRIGGKKLRAADISFVSDDVRPGSPVIVYMGSKAGTGVLLEDPARFPDIEEAVLKVKGLAREKLKLYDAIPSLDEVVQANLPYLEKLRDEALHSIREITGRKKYRNLPVHVSFSGGKDSLVTLSLALEALPSDRLKAFFVNTGLEFPETVRFVHEFCEQHDIPLIEEKAGEAFWDNVGSFGPPGKDFRWCCKVCKLGPANAVMEKCLREYGTCLTIDGKRKYESFSRAETREVETNPFVRGQVNIFPLRNWRAFEVWLYIFRNRLPYNPLYDMGFERVGCYLCPSSLASEFERVRQIHPDLYGRWHCWLENWVKAHGLPETYIDYGFWRWKEPPAKMRLLAEKCGIPLSVEGGKTGFGLEMVSGHSPCKDGSYSMELAVSGISLEDAASVLKVVGEVRLAEKPGLLMLKSGDASFRMFASGNVQITGRARGAVEELYRRCAKELLRMAKCTGCGVCVHACPANALVLEGSKIRVLDCCTHCGRCTDACVVVRYSGKF
jgi:phosphoadenosine phosphosulfate reductase